MILKIPFKDMWNGQIDAIVEELFILVVPTSQIAYNEDKETKAQLEAKRAELARVEKRKQLADLKCKNVSRSEICTNREIVRSLCFRNLYT